TTEWLGGGASTPARGPVRQFTEEQNAAGDRRAPARVAAILAAPMILVAANPYSGAADNRRRVDALARELAALAGPPRVLWDARERAAALADPAAMAGCRVVVAAGGDGTVGEGINQPPSRT